MARAIPALLAAAAALCAAQPIGAQAINYADLQGVIGEPVTTSVTGKPQRESDVPASVTIITRDEIQRSPARSVPDLLKLHAGVDVNRWTEGQSDVAVRGGVQTYNARLLVLVNGRQVYLDHYGMTDWNLLGIQIEEIQQIELVRGPASALFGFNAATGVVNIITVDPLAGPHGTATVEGGNHGQFRASGFAALPISSNVGLELSGSHSRADERAIPSFLYQPARIDDVTADQANARLGFTPDPATRVDLEGGWADNRQLEFLPSQLLTEEHYRSEHVGATASHDTGWGGLTARAYTNWLDADYGITTRPTDVLSSISSSSFRNRITVAQASALVRLDDVNTLRVGLEFRDNQLRSTKLYAPRVGYLNGAASAMLDLHPTDRLAVSLAARVDRLWLDEGGAVVEPKANPVSDFDRIITQPSFNAGVVLQVGAQGQLRVNGGRGLQLPSLAQLGSRLVIPEPAAPFPVLLAGDPRLASSIVWSGEAGYTRRFGQALRLDGTFFYTRTEHSIATPGSNASFAFAALPLPVLVARFADVGSFETLGVQAGASGKVGTALGWHLNYTWTHVAQRLPLVGPDLAYAFSPRDTTPEHVANLSLDYARAGWTLGLAGHYASGTRQFAFGRAATLLLVPVHDALTLDAKLGRAITRHLSAYVVGENLGKAAGAYGSPIPGDRRVRAGIRFAI